MLFHAHTHARTHTIAHTHSILLSLSQLEFPKNNRFKAHWGSQWQMQSRSWWSQKTLWKYSFQEPLVQSVTDNAGNKESAVLPRPRKMAAKGTMKASSELLFLLGLLSFCVIVCPWNQFCKIFKMAAWRSNLNLPELGVLIHWKNGLNV